MKQIDFLRDVLATEMMVTSWHWNDSFFEFWDRYYKGKSLEQVRKGLSYYMRKLVKCGDAYPSERLGLGCGGGFEFGVNYQTVWKIKNSNLRKEYIERALKESK